MKQQSDPVGQLSDAIADEARAVGLDVTISRSRRDGFGMLQTAVIEVATGAAPDPILLWHERGNDFWIEFGTVAPGAAWWSKGDDLAVLAKVVVSSLRGSLDVSGGRVTVRVEGMKPIRLAERL